VPSNRPVSDGAPGATASPGGRATSAERPRRSRRKAPDPVALAVLADESHREGYTGCRTGRGGPFTASRGRPAGDPDRHAERAARWAIGSSLVTTRSTAESRRPCRTRASVRCRGAVRGRGSGTARRPGRRSGGASERRSAGPRHVRQGAKASIGIDRRSGASPLQWIATVNPPGPATPAPSAPGGAGRRSGRGRGGWWSGRCRAAREG